MYSQLNPTASPTQRPPNASEWMQRLSVPSLAVKYVISHAALLARLVGLVLHHSGGLKALKSCSTRNVLQDVGLGGDEGGAGVAGELSGGG